MKLPDEFDHRATYHAEFRAWVASIQRVANQRKPSRARTLAQKQLAFMKSHGLMSPSSNPGRGSKQDDDKLIQEHSDLLLHL
jgi:hypothetical protein